MAEATQQYVPMQSQSVAPAVGAAPGMPQDTMFESVYNYAQKQNVTNLQTAREEEYVEGQLLAAQNNGVQEVRESQPWVSQIFGGGAALSGAMDYMEQTKLLEYQEDINNNMDEYRRMRPEDFKTQQMEKIKQFYTDDDETNQHIMRTFGMALPSIVNTQSKAHEGFKQEQHLSKMTTFVNMSLRVAQRARESGDDADRARAEGFLDNSLKMPVGMNKDAYKQFLYGQLQTASASGDTAVAARIADMGLINTPADVDLLDKAETTLLKYKAGQERFAYGQTLNSLTEAATQLTKVSDDNFALAVKAASEKYPMSGAKVGEMLNLRLRAKQQQLKAVNTQGNVDLFAEGKSNLIPTSQRQDTYAIAWENTKENPDMAPDFWQKLAVTGDTANVVKSAFRAGLNHPFTVDPETGEDVISEPAHTAIMDMKIARDATRDNGTPGVFSKHIDLYSRELFNAYEIAEQGMPGAGEYAHMRAAMDGLESHKDAATGASVKIADDKLVTVLDELEDLGNFDADVFTDQKYMETAMQGIMAGIDIRMPPAQIAGQLEHNLLTKYEENDDGVWSAKIHGKSVQERSDIAEPWKKVKNWANATLTVKNNDGTPVSVVAKDVSYGLDGSRDAFIVYDNETHVPIAKITFDELKVWRSPVKEKPPVTTSNQASHDKIVRQSRRRYLTWLQKKKDAEVPEGYETEAAKGQRMLDSNYMTEEAVSAMSDEDVVNAYQEVVATEGADNSLSARLLDFYDSAVASVGDVVDDFMVDTVDVAIANMYEAYGKQDEAMDAFNMQGYHEYVEAIAKEEVPIAQALGRNFSSVSDMQAKVLGRTGSQVDNAFGEKDIALYMQQTGKPRDEVIAEFEKVVRATNKVFAVTAYQIIPKTMESMPAKLKKKVMDMKMTPEVQEMIFDEYLITKQPGMKKYLNPKTKNPSLEVAYAALGEEWTSMKKPEFRDEALAALEAARGGNTAPLKAVIKKGESDSAGGYNAYNRGTLGKKPDGSQRIINGETPIDFSELTVREVMALQQKR